MGEERSLAEKLAESIEIYKNELAKNYELKQVLNNAELTELLSEPLYKMYELQLRTEYERRN